MVVEDAFFKHDGVVEGTAWFCRDDGVAVLEDGGGFIGAIFEYGGAVFEVVGIAGIAEDAGYRHLGEGGGTDFEAFRGEEALDIGGEIFVLFTVENFGPSAAGAGPGVFFADAA